MPCNEINDDEKISIAYYFVTGIKTNFEKEDINPDYDLGLTLIAENIHNMKKNPNETIENLSNKYSKLLSLYYSDSNS